MTSAEFIPLPSYSRYSSEEMRLRAASFREQMQRRRSVRQFSDRPVEREIIEQCLLIV